MTLIDPRQDVVLEGAHVRLEPLTRDHLDGLCAVGIDPAIWRLSPWKQRTRADLEGYIETALAARAAGHALPFATVHRASGRVAGSTRFGEVAAEHRRTEIGWTWLGTEFQRTAVNTEAKFLMLRHAFETWGCVRVELRTDVLNERSRNAILRIGATEEGVLRQQIVCDDGRLRDSVYFSILDREWPAVRARHESLMARPPAGS
jgi:RimJ/RimL family protein N-acetyltransferase